MKVALFNDTFLPRGGTERHLVDAAHLLAQAGIETLFIAAQDEENAIGWPTLFESPLFFKGALKQALPKLEAMLHAQNVDVVHLVHMHHPDVTEFLAERFPTVRTIHTAYLFCVAGTRYLPHTRRICPQTCSLQCLATHWAEGCIRYADHQTYPLPHQLKKLALIQRNHLADTGLKRIGVASAFMKELLTRHGYDDTLIDIIPPPITAAMETVSPTPIPRDTPPSIVYCGRLIPEKGVSDLLQAMLLIQTPARLIIVGDGPARPALEQDAATLGLADRVTFRGAVSPDVSRTVYREGGVTVFPSLWPEPFGFTGIESFLNHRPVVAYAGGGVSDWLIDGKNGILIPSHDIAVLAQALNTLLNDPQRSEAMGAWGDRFVREQFSRQRHVEAKLRFYRQAIHAFGNTSPARPAGVTP